MRTGRVLGLMLAGLGAGCGTTRMTDTQRAASEMVLISHAIDDAIAQLDFSALNGKTVYLDTQYLDGTVDKGYLISALRQHLLAHGAMLQDDRQKAVYVVEARAGGVGTDKHSLLIGTPSITLPSITPVPITNIPEIALIKRTDQRGVAKLAVFAYNRMTGRALWQSGLVQANSTLKDTWVFGAGPFSRGTIRQQTELAGEPLPKIPIPFYPNKSNEDEGPDHVMPASANQPYVWPNADVPPPPAPVPFPLLGVTGAAAVVDRPLILFDRPNPPPAGNPAGAAPGMIQSPPHPLPKVN